MKNKYQNYLIKQIFFCFKTTVAIGIITTLFFYVWRISLRPPRTNLKQEIATGIIYQRKVFSTPRPCTVHIVEIDLGNSNIRPLVTPSDIQQPHGSNLAMTTSDFVKKFDLILGVNASFFYPFERAISPHSTIFARGKWWLGRRHKAKPNRYIFGGQVHLN